MFSRRSDEMTDCGRLLNPCHSIVVYAVDRVGGGLNSGYECAAEKGRKETGVQFRIGCGF